MVFINPQLKSCGSIEASFLFHVSASSHDNPQLKSCGSIEARCTYLTKLNKSQTIRNWKVAAPLKQKKKEKKVLSIVHNPQLKSCGSIEASPNFGTGKWGWKTIRNWKVAAPLKRKWCWLGRRYKISTIRNWKVAAPLKLKVSTNCSGCTTYNPQLKSCGSIEAKSVSNQNILFSTTIRNWKVAAPLKQYDVKFHYSSFITIRNWKVAAPLKQ